MPHNICGKLANAYCDGNPARTPQMWFERMRHQLRSPPRSGPYCPTDGAIWDTLFISFRNHSISAINTSFILQYAISYQMHANSHSLALREHERAFRSTVLNGGFCIVGESSPRVRAFHFMQCYDLG